MQGQAVRWIRNMEAGSGIKTVSVTASDMMRQVGAGGKEPLALGWK